jgi:putative DNA primase/helicase
LQEILAENSAGLMVLRDELVGLIAEMDKEGRESQRTFLLRGWNGYGAFTVDRIQRGTIHIPNVCLSVFGNIQPGRLREYLGDTLTGGPADDGLFQRFQILVWPDAPTAWRLVDRMPNNSALACAEKIFSRLANLPNESVRMRFAPMAQQLFFDWWAKLEAKVRDAEGTHPALVAHLSKYRSLMPSLAALFELADQLAENFDLGNQAEVDEAHAAQAVEMCSYLEAHARRVYSCITSPQLHAARELAKHIQRGRLSDAFTARDVYKKDWSGLDEDRVPGALRCLADAGWLRKIQTPPSPTGGRPTDRWEINPSLKKEGES